LKDRNEDDLVWVNEQGEADMKGRPYCVSCAPPQESISWSELAELTHATQVERFNFCTCEDSDGNGKPYADCPEGVEDQEN
jgi:hypothetical protein